LSPEPSAPAWKRRPFLWLAAALLALLILCVIFLEPPASTLFWEVFFDSGHAPLFGVVSLILLLLCTSARNLFPVLYQWRYWIAASSGLVLGFGTETVQALVGRDAEMGDVLHDAVGIVAFLAAALTFDPSFAINRSALFRMVTRIAAVALLGTVIYPPITCGIGSWQRDRSFPTLVSFDRIYGDRYLFKIDAVCVPGDPPEQWTEGHSSRVGRITFLPSIYSTLVLRETVPDWRSYDSLALNFFSPAGHRFKLAVRVEDWLSRSDYSNRYNQLFEIGPGLTRLRIPLEAIARGPVSRKLDLDHITELAIFAPGVTDTFTVFVDSIRLIR
jgi:VanZ family protein